MKKLLAGLLITASMVRAFAGLETTYIDIKSDYGYTLKHYEKQYTFTQDKPSSKDIANAVRDDKDLLRELIQNYNEKRIQGTLPSNPLGLYFTGKIENGDIKVDA
jgi:hypothetical protein